MKKIEDIKNEKFQIKFAALKLEKEEEKKLNGQLKKFRGIFAIAIILEFIALVMDGNTFLSFPKIPFMASISLIFLFISVYFIYISKTPISKTDRGDLIYYFILSSLLFILYMLDETFQFNLTGMFGYLLITVSTLMFISTFGNCLFGRGNCVNGILIIGLIVVFAIGYLLI
jgi:hypothetical protein